MIKRIINLFLIVTLVFPTIQVSAQTEAVFDNYHSYEEIQKILKKYGKRRTKLHNITKSPGGREVTIIEIGTEYEDAPAIFVGANFEGNIPLATEGALFLAQLLQDTSVYSKSIKWYILPQPNPDAAEGYFENTKWELTTNQIPINDDGDDQIDEDGFEDLNSDGLITQMRIKDVEGDYIVSEANPFFMKKADVSKGEKGMYKLYTEGFDNDGDGLYNEDGTGGINVGIAFPHLFPRENSKAGMYPGQTPEVYHIMRFIYDRPEIAMVVTLGSSNFCLVPPKGGRKGGADLENIKLSGWNARRLGAESGKTYKMNEVMEMVEAIVPQGMEVTPQMVAGMLGLGAAVNPLKDDLAFYKTFSEEYKSYLEGKNFKTETLPPEPAKDGSFELWAYYHLGVPSFSMNLFTIPKVEENKDDTLAVKGNEEASQKTTKDDISAQDKALLFWSAKEWGGQGVVPWEKVNHKSLGEVEVGGYVPYLKTTPNSNKINYLLNMQIPWLFQLSNKLPSFEIEDFKAINLGADVYRVELLVVNTGELSYPISIGERNGQPAPLILVLDGDIELLEGTKRTRVGRIKAKQVKKLSWVVRSKGKRPTMSATLESAVFEDITKQINIGG